MRGARYHHTAHEPTLAVIRYRYHPFYGEEVEVLRRSRGYRSVLVRVRQNGVQLALPAWMLDEVFCAQLRYKSEPLIATSALIALRELLDAQPLFASLAETGQQRRRISRSGG